MACDLCGKTGTELIALRDSYKSDEIQQICPGCEEVVNKHLRKVQSVAANIVGDLMRRFMRRRAGKAEQ